MMNKRAIIWDRDGTLNELIDRGDGIKTAPWVPSELKIIDGAREAINITRDLGFLNFVITNQPDVEMIGRDKLLEMHEWMCHVLNLNFIYMANNRIKTSYKPGPALAHRIAYRFGVDLTRCWVVGDSWRDIGLAKNIGARSIQIGIPNESQTDRPDFSAPNALHATHIIRRMESQ